MTPLRTKATAPAAAMPQTVTDVERAIATIAKLRDELAENAAALDGHILTLRERAAVQAKPIEAEIERLSKGVQAYCETRRGELTDGGKTKTLKFVTGAVSWRKGRARIETDGDEAAVIARLKRAGLAAFVRLREELDKTEILKRPHLVAGIAGLRVVEPSEAFSIEPKKG